jgi:tetratricopeptide (TPR) repeat protein
MKNCLLIIIIISFCSVGVSQEIKNEGSETFLSELSDNACKCIDSINIYNLSKVEVASKISDCINKQVGAFQLFSKIMKIDELKADAEISDSVKQIDISVNLDANSEEYKNYYYELERYLMANCSSLKEKIATNDIQNVKSMSENEEAIEFYSKGLEETKKENYKKAIEYYKKAVNVDPEFAYAWDNMGINYRRLDNYDKAIECYKKSLEIDPYGLMPIQNIAIAYQYKKEYSKAIEAYKKLAEIDRNNPEVYYGIGHVYASNLNDYEKGLDYMCKAYNMYIEQKSPYRVDAEKMIQFIYTEMIKQGKEEEFNKILKANNISQN